MAERGDALRLPWKKGDREEVLLQSRPCRESILGERDVDPQAKGFAYQWAGDHFFDRAGGHGAPVAQQQRVGEAGRDLLNMMGHKHHRGHGRVVGERSQLRHEPLPGAKVEACRGLVEHHEFGMAHTRTRQLDLLALAFGKHPERTIRDVAESGRLEQIARPLRVGRFVGMPPRFERAESSRHNDIHGGQRRTDLFGERRAHHRNPLTMQAPVHAAAQVRPQEFEVSPGGMEVTGDELHQRRLARPVRPEHDPSLLCLHRPVEPVEGPRLERVVGHGDLMEIEDRHGTGSVPGSHRTNSIIKG